jgi:hypothetical protein
MHKVALSQMVPLIPLLLFSPLCALVATFSPFLVPWATAEWRRDSSSHTHAVSPHKSHTLPTFLPPAVTLHAVHLTVSGGLRHYHHQGEAEQFTVVTLLSGFQCFSFDNETKNIKISIDVPYGCKGLCECIYVTLQTLVTTQFIYTSTVEPGYNEIGLYETSLIESHTVFGGTN